MRPTVLASFVIFFLSAMRFFLNGEINVARSLKPFIVITIITTSFYFYYLTIAVEAKWKDIPTPKKYRLSNWIIQTLQFILFYSLWFSLEYGIRWYASLLLFIYVTYIIWNLIHYNYLMSKNEGKYVFWFDIVGLAFCMFFFIVSFIIPEKIELNRGVTTVNDINKLVLSVISSGGLALSAIFGLGVLVFQMKYNPIQVLDINGDKISITIWRILWNYMKNIFSKPKGTE